MTLDLDAIEKAAREAQASDAGLWVVEPWQGAPAVFREHGTIIASTLLIGQEMQPVAKHIATSHPAAVLEMVAEIRRTAAEVLDHQRKLARLYQAMCGAMANWEPLDPGDPNVSAAEWERVGKAREEAYAEMHAVFNASPGVLYQGGPGASEALKRMDELRRLAPPPSTPTP